MTADLPAVIGLQVLLAPGSAEDVALSRGYQVEILGLRCHPISSKVTTRGVEWNLGVGSKGSTN